MSEQIVCVSAGMMHPKKADTLLARLHQYLNYGLLGLASILNDRGYRATLFHGGFCNPRTFADRLHNEKRLDTRYPLLLSLPSSFALSWAREFSAAAKTLAPGLRIIVGGRWVTGTDGA